MYNVVYKLAHSSKKVLRKYSTAIDMCAKKLNLIEFKLAPNGDVWKYGMNILFKI